MTTIVRLFSVLSAECARLAERANRCRRATKTAYRMALNGCRV